MKQLKHFHTFFVCVESDQWPFEGPMAEKWRDLRKCRFCNDLVEMSTSTFLLPLIKEALMQQLLELQP